MSLLEQTLLQLRNTVSRSPSPGNAGSALSSPGRKQRTLLPEYACTIACRALDINVVAGLPDTFSWGTSAQYDTPLRDSISGAVNSIPMANSVMGIARMAGVSLVTQTLSAKVWSGSSSNPITLELILQAHTDEVTEVIQPLIDLMALNLPRLSGGKRGGLLTSPGPYLDVVAATQNAANRGRESLSIAGQKIDRTGGFLNSISSQFNRLTSAADSSSFSGKAMNAVVQSLGQAGTTLINGAADALEGVDDFVRDHVKNTISLRLGNYMMFPNVVITDVSQSHHVLPVGAAHGRSTGNMSRVDVTVTFEPFFDIVLDDLHEIFLDERVRSYVKTLIARANAGNPLVRR